ncbi:MULTISPECIES: MbtH domain protein [unclassified Massilia]|uniref:MbtH domain protein n=1 Tax=unclassified Massilia TaxID=2609279 RepID=UPI00177DAEA9|nr:MULTISPECIES: MbtH domain protein [unclassified Massilia]MBD8529982.1 MbtH domain protein [Massilia sp. CFBP 13647]MBD8673900.1 MbtH domain protein [Massilia sp. CFBP 13721]
MSPLVEKLSQAQHPLSLIRYKSSAELRAALARGVVLVKFTGTQGGTELAVQLDQPVRELDEAAGEYELSGSLTLDYQPVACSATIALATLTGFGCLKVVEPA